MENINLTGTYRNKLREQTNQGLNYNYIFFVLLSFLLGQAELIGGIYPFSLLYWSLFIEAERKLLLMVSLGTSLGLITGGVENLPYLAAGIGLLFYKFVIKKYFNNDVVLSFLICVSFLTAFFTVYLSRGTIPYLYLRKAGEGVLLFLLIPIVRDGSRELTWSRKNLSIVEKITVLVFSTGIVLPLLALPFSEIIINIILLLIIVSATYTAGLYPGLFLAVFYGLVFSGIGIIPTVTMIKYLLFAMVCGLFVNRRKPLMVICFVLCFFLYSGFAPSLYNIKTTALETVIMGAVFFLLPARFMADIFNRFYNTEEIVTESRVSAQNYSHPVKQRLQELAGVFSELAVTFREVLPERDDFDDFVFLFKNKNCGKCPLKRKCWYKSPAKTKKVLREMVTAAEKKHKMDKEITKRYLSKICDYAHRILPGTRSSYELYRINRFWRNRMIDKQQMVSQQLQGVGNIIKDFSGEHNINVGYNLSGKKIKAKINKYNLNLEEIEIRPGPGAGKKNIRMKVEPCSGNQPCLYQIKKILNSEFNYKFRLLTKTCGNILEDRSCCLHYSPVGDYCLEVAARQQPLESDVAGDTYDYSRLKTGEDVVILSDGMGTGAEAAGESKTAVRLFMQIIRAGFSRDMAIKTINSALFLRSHKEKFTTMDIAFFNTFSGVLNLSKIGAMSTFIKRGWNIIEIKSSNLPVGIMEKIKVSTREEELEENDLVFMLSDGILDSGTTADNKEEWFRNLLRKTSINEPRVFADYIMEEIIKKGNIRDDMTLIVLKVKKEF